MTNEEAKTKWCPYAASRVCSYATNGGVEWHQFIQENGLNGKCIGSDCAAWRTIKDEPESFPYDGGYCGLAGKP